MEGSHSEGLLAGGAFVALHAGVWAGSVAGPGEVEGGFELFGEEHDFGAFHVEEGQFEGDFLAGRSDLLEEVIEELDDLAIESGLDTAVGGELEGVIFGAAEIDRLGVDGLGPGGGDGPEVGESELEISSGQLAAEFGGIFDIEFGIDEAAPADLLEEVHFGDEGKFRLEVFD